MHKYSRRLPWDFFSNSLTQQALARKNRGEPTLDLTKSNPTAVLDDYPHSAIANAFSEITTFDYEPQPSGSENARLAICRYYKSRGLTLSPDRLLLTASTSESYSLLFKLLCDPDDEILVPAPSYPLFEYLAALESVRVQHYRLRFDGSWYIDFDHLRQRMNARTRAIVVVNPNNPTGSFVKQHELETLCQIAFENDVPIISDEVFQDYAFDSLERRATSMIGRDACLSFSLNGLSKSAGMPQMKVGWIVMNGAEPDSVMARERLELIADTYLSVGTPVQKALPKLFEIGDGIHRMIYERTLANLGTLQRILHDGTARALHCEAGWSAIIRLPATQSEESWTLRLLDKCGILVQPGYFFDMESEPHIVLSLITQPDDFAAGISRIREVAN